MVDGLMRASCLARRGEPSQPHRSDAWRGRTMPTGLTGRAGGPHSAGQDSFRPPRAAT